MKKSQLKALIKEVLEDDALDELSEIIVSLRQLQKKFAKSNDYVAKQLNAIAENLEDIQNKYLGENKLLKEETWTAAFNIASGESVEVEDSDKIVLKPNKNYNLIIDYPLDKPVKEIIKSGPKGWTLEQLIEHIDKKYQEIYSQGKKYGIYGHGIGDLYLNSIFIKNNNITLEVDS